MDIDLIASLNEDNIEEVVIPEDVEEKEQPEEFGIICAICRERVGLVRRSELKLPLRGNMFHPHRGCEHWPFPGAWEGPQDFVCPHAVDGDKHCFILVNEGEPDASDSLLVEDFTVFTIKAKKCPCGCGQDVAEGNKYANNLECYRRHIGRG